MLSFFVKRLAQGIVVVVGVTVVVFFVTRIVGDPVSHLLPLEATAEEKARLSEQLGFNDPIAQQFVDFTRDVVRLDFGDSIWQQVPAMEIIGQRLPATFRLVFFSMLFATILGLLIGILASLWPNSFLDRLSVVSSLLGLSVPKFWLGLLMIMLFSVTLGWLPSSGGTEFKFVVMPALTLGLPAAGKIAQMTRASIIDESRQPYVVTARAKGLGSRYILVRHVLRNSFLPILGVVGWEVITTLAGFTVVVETVFQWPGMGFLASQALERQDFVLLQGIVFVVALMVVSMNILMDVLASWVDPRIKLT
jgi:peptide/nickel transport system permease protein